MRKFTKAGTVQKISGTNNWRVVEPFFWYISYEEKNKRIIVEQGFTSDFGSVPRLFWFLINPTEYNAFILHDKMYSKGIMTRKIADTVLLNALIVEGCNVFKAYIIYIVVRLCGFLYWKK